MADGRAPAAVPARGRGGQHGAAGLLRPRPRAAGRLRLPNVAQPGRRLAIRRRHGGQRSPAATSARGLGGGTPRSPGARIRLLYGCRTRGGDRPCHGGAAGGRARRRRRAPAGYHRTAPGSPGDPGSCPGSGRRDRGLQRQGARRRAGPQPLRTGPAGGGHRQCGRGVGAACLGRPAAAGEACRSGGDGSSGGGCDMSGRLAVVGIGPGSPEQLTQAAVKELSAAELLIGYRGYLAQLPADLAPGRREAFGLGEERARARRAVAAASEGMRVALVSGGDAGIYGTASLAIDETVAFGEGAPPLVVVPGVTAAVAAAALVGAPLAVDFACLSLSDLLLPRSELLAKIDALAAANIVLVLYNPASRSRREPWEAAVASVQRHRARATPVVAVRRAYREGQAVELCDVDGMTRLQVDMETVVIVGSSHTRQHGGWLYTLRDEALR